MKKEFQKSITPDEIKELPVAGFEGKIVVVDTLDGLHRACEALSKEKIIGFDTETRPSFKAGVSYNVSLVQLSTATTCYLIRLCSVRFDKVLQKLLENREVLKVAVESCTSDT